MTDRRKPVTELDLLAYADGLLDRDPSRKAEVEAYLESHPAESRRIGAYLRQNEAIRRVYRPALDAPVPDRLHAVLGARLRPPRRTGMRSAAVLAGVAVCAGLGGWVIGKGERTAIGPQTQAFVEQAMLGHAMSPAQPRAGTRIVRNEGEAPLDWLTEQIPVRIKLPDLSAHGYTMTDKRVVASEGQQLVQVVYSDARGRRLSLFLQARWQGESTRLRLVQGDDLNVAYWVDGPFVYGLAGGVARRELASLASSVRDTMKSRPGSSGPGSGHALRSRSEQASGAEDEKAAIAQPEDALGLMPVQPSGL